MGKILDEFRRQRLFVTNMNYGESRSRIAGFLDWLNSNDVTASIISEIENDGKVIEILNKSDYQNPPVVSNPEEVVQIGIYFMRQVKTGKEIWGFSQKYGILPSFSTKSVQDFQNEVVDRYIEPAIDYIQDKLVEKIQVVDNMTSTSPSQADPKKVFVIHGRNQEARNAMFTFLRAIGLQPLEWEHAVILTSNPSPYIGEILDKAFHTVQAFVVLLTGDDEARLREQFQTASDEDYEKMLTPQARPNVLFEAGLAFGIHPDRVVLVQLGKIRPFSDVVGRFTVRITNQIGARQGFANRLRSAGCEVNIDGIDWHTAGDFDSAVNSFAENTILPTITEEPDDSYYHFRIQQLLTASGKADKPKHLFNQRKSALNNVAENLKLGNPFQMEGITVSGFDINYGAVSLSILRSKSLAETTNLEPGNTVKIEKYWGSLKRREDVVDITTELKVFDKYKK